MAPCSMASAAPAALALLAVLLLACGPAASTGIKIGGSLGAAANKVKAS